jgi:hypothetical protein
MPVEQLASAELTGRWEARLSTMAEGNEQRDHFMADVRTSLAEMIDAIRVATPPPAERIASDEPSLGSCPVCSEPVRERRSVYACDRGRACDFVIFKTMSKRKISKTSVKQLLSSGRSKMLKNFKSKKGKNFNAALTLDKDNKVSFDFSDNTQTTSETKSAAESVAEPAAKPTAKPAAKPAAKPTAKSVAEPAAASAASTPVGMLCPQCGSGRLIQGRTAWGCGRWREGCRFVLPFMNGSEPRSPLEAARLIAEQQAG